MVDIMEVNPDNSLVVVPLTEVLHVDRSATGSMLRALNIVEGIDLLQGQVRSSASRSFSASWDRSNGFSRRIASDGSVIAPPRSSCTYPDM